MEPPSTAPPTTELPTQVIQPPPPLSDTTTTTTETDAGTQPPPPDKKTLKAARLAKKQVAAAIAGEQSENKEWKQGYHCPIHKTPLHHKRHNSYDNYECGDIACNRKIRNYTNYACCTKCPQSCDYYLCHFCFDK